MKRMLTVMILSLSLGIAIAQTTESGLPNTLKNTMKAMANNLKVVSTQASNPQENQSSATLADQFVLLAAHAKAFTPDSVSSATEKADYDKVCDQVAQLGQQLASAFRANENTKANDLLNQLAQAKKDGHIQYK